MSLLHVFQFVGPVTESPCAVVAAVWPLTRVDIPMLFQRLVLDKPFVAHFAVVRLLVFRRVLGQHVILVRHLRHRFAALCAHRLDVAPFVLRQGGGVLQDLFRRVYFS